MNIIALFYNGCLLNFCKKRNISQFSISDILWIIASENHVRIEQKNIKSFLYIEKKTVTPENFKIFLSQINVWWPHKEFKLKALLETLRESYT